MSTEKYQPHQPKPPKKSQTPCQTSEAKQHCLDY